MGMARMGSGSVRTCTGTTGKIMGNRQSMVNRHGKATGKEEKAISFLMAVNRGEDREGGRRNNGPAAGEGAREEG